MRSTTDSRPAPLLLNLAGALAVLSSIQSALALTVLIHVPDMTLPIGTSSIPAWTSGLQCIVASSMGVWLWVRRSDDARAKLLGTGLLILGASFSQHLLAAGSNGDGGLLTSLCAALVLVPADAFMAASTWSFYSVFPLGRRSDRERLAANVMLALSIAFGFFVIFGEPLAQTLGIDAEIHREASAPYWAWVFSLIALSMGYSWLGHSRADWGERRRASRLASALLLSLLPAVLYGLLVTVSPGLPDAARAGGWPTLALAVVHISLALGLVAAALVLVADGSLESRRTMKSTWTYAVSRAIGEVVLLAPVPGLAWALYLGRELPLREFASSPAGLGAGLLILTLGATRLIRPRWIADIDHRFDRVRPDAGAAILRLVDSADRAETLEDWSLDFIREIRDVLGVKTANLLLIAESGRLEAVSKGARPLPEDTNLTAIADRLVGATLIVDLRGGLGSSDARWLMEHQIRCVAPLRDHNGSISGVVLLGPTKNDSDLDESERATADSLTRLAPMLIARYRIDENTAAQKSKPKREDTALECDLCGSVHISTAIVCAECGGKLSPSSLPRVLNGKFTIDARIGEGSMGVVYKAVDRHVGRHVAVKTLQRVPERQSLSLQDEARAMAAVTGPHLAVLYGLEYCNNTPVLVVELLGQGTLNVRIARGPLPSSEVIQLGIALADALRSIHGGGVLHRDIKPSNIGFDDQGTPKLMDFGLANIAMAKNSRLPDDLDRLPVDPRATSLVDGLVGTPLYLPPEVFYGAPSGPEADLWGLSMVLYECLTGVHPAERDNWPATMNAICAGNFRPADEVINCSSALSDTLRDALAVDPAQRPKTADDLIERLKSLR